MLWKLVLKRVRMRTSPLAMDLAVSFIHGQTHGEGCDSEAAEGSR
jgi:hypothetical protein